MSEREPHTHFPLLPDPWPRPGDLVPPPSPVNTDQASARAPTAERPVRGPVAPELPTTSGPEPEPSTIPQGVPEVGELGERPRVTLAGRLGQNPRTRTTPKGTLVAQFPLGVKDDVDLSKTTWHQVVAFNERAEQVRDTLKRGDLVEVIGYRHTREHTRRDGTSRVTDEVYATVIKPR